jgi:hypothetical protein
MELEAGLVGQELDVLRAGQGWVARADQPERPDRPVARRHVGHDLRLVAEVGPERHERGGGDEDLLGRSGNEQLLGPAEQDGPLPLIDGEAGTGTRLVQELVDGPLQVDRPLGFGQQGREALGGPHRAR